MFTLFHDNPMFRNSFAPLLSLSFFSFPVRSPTTFFLSCSLLYFSVLSRTSTNETAHMYICVCVYGGGGAKVKSREGEEGTMLIVTLHAGSQSFLPSLFLSVCLSAYSSSDSLPQLRPHQHTHTRLALAVVTAMDNEADGTDRGRRQGAKGDGEWTSRHNDDDSTCSNSQEAEAAEDEMVARAGEIRLVPQYVDMPDADLLTIMRITLRVYNDLVLVPARNTWRKDEGSRRELELEIERTSLTEMTKNVKKAVDAKLGGCWHVVYGRDYGTYVSHQKQSCCYFQLDGANVVVWRHGM